VAVCLAKQIINRKLTTIEVMKPGNIGNATTRSCGHVRMLYGHMRMR